VKLRDAQTVHPGHGVPVESTRRRINTWLEANGIDPRLVLAERPIYVLAVANGTIQGGLPWLIDVIVFHQYYEHPDGTRELDFITHEAVSFQRTVPLRVPFPTDPTTGDEGASDGKEQKVEAAEEDERSPQHQGGPEEDEQQELRPAEAEEVSNRRPRPCQERTDQGSSERIEEHPEDDPSEGHQALPQPEEDRQQGKEVAP
jgi:hypothetical protein